jgi:hypothetical protein
VLGNGGVLFELFDFPFGFAAFREVNFNLPTGPDVSLDLGNADVDLLYLLDDDNTAALS